MPQQIGGDDRDDDLAALDFCGPDASGSHSDGVAESDALDFSATADDSGEEAAVDALAEFAPAEPEETGSELDAIDSVTEDTEDEDDDMQLFTVTNPPETVSVSTLMGGTIQRVDLSPKVVGMSESELTDEILVLADLARQKGLAGQHTYMFEAMRALGVNDNEAACDLLENVLDLSSPKQAEEAQAEVFSTRYNSDRG